MSEALRRDPSQEMKSRIGFEESKSKSRTGGAGKKNEQSNPSRPVYHGTDGESSEIASVLDGLQKAEEASLKDSALKKAREEITGITELSPWDIQPASKSDEDKLKNQEFETAMLLDDRHKRPPMFNVPGKGRITLPKGK